REQIGERDNDGVGVALLALDVEKAFGSRAAGLIDDDERLRGKLVLLSDAGDEPRHLVGAAARAGRHDDLNRFRRLPRRHLRDRRPREEGEPCESTNGPRPAKSHMRPLLRRAWARHIVRNYRRLAPGDQEHPWPNRHGRARRRARPSHRSRIVYFPAPSFQNGMTPGISHLFHISSTLAWKYPRSSSVKWANRPCLSRYSRTGFRGRPSTMALVLP